MGEKVKFKPVKIIDRLKNGKVMISCGVNVDGEEGIIFFEDKKVQTVKKYEVVYVNAEEIEEGGYIYWGIIIYIYLKIWKKFIKILIN